MRHNKASDFLKSLNSHVAFLRLRSINHIMILLALLSLSFPNQIIAQSLTTCEKALLIIKTAEIYHYNPRIIDDKFSELVFDEFVSLLDPEGTIFTIDEITRLESSKYTLDEDILNNKCDFVIETGKLYHNKLLWLDSLINTIKVQGLDFNRQDTLHFSKEEIYVDNKQLIERWNGIIKIQVLSSYLSGFEAEQDPPMPSPEKIADILESIIMRESCSIKSKTESFGGIEEYIGSKFLKAISFAFDPHTEYFTPIEEQEFLRSLSTDTYSFGLEIYKNNLGEIEVYGIAPGSPAWNSNACNEGDVILDIYSEEATSYELNCLSMSEVISFMYSDEIDEASFTLRKKNKREVTVTLHKEQIEVEENVIKSFILQGDRKIGYIYLPSFYSKMDYITYTPNGCSNDMAKELIKLKKEGIQGLIIDIRNNGGGSMLEAIQMAGIFINYGALAILHTRGEEPVTLKDLNRGTVYDGPLVILQNSYSASASELLSATLQDHNRAIVVGGPSFGKSTGQEILPLNANMDRFTLNGTSEGYLKITGSTFFRVTGESHQKEGIIPDIKLPDLFDHFESGERIFSSALDHTSIQKKTYYYPLTPLPINELQTNSENRIKNDSPFNTINEMGISLGEILKQYSIPLAYDLFKEYYFSIQLFQNYEEIPQSDGELFLVKNPSYMTGISDFKDSDKEINEDVMVNIGGDVYIKESYQIINDLITLIK